MNFSCNFFNKYLPLVCLLLAPAFLIAQGNKTFIFTGATIHVGNGKVIENGVLIVQGDKITYVGTTPTGTNKTGVVVDLKGKHLYPGLIALNNYAGLNEIDAAKPTRDFAEVGELNPNIRSLTSYNCDSRILPTLVCNGIAYTQPTPQSGILCGSSSLVKTSCGNWEDAVLVNDIALHVHWPEYFPQPWWSDEQKTNQKKNTEEQLARVKQFFTDARSYFENPLAIKETKFESVRRVFAGSQKVFLSATAAPALIDAVLFFKSLGVSVVWVNGDNAMSILPFLKENKVPVLLQTIHQMPDAAHKEIAGPFTLAAKLNAAGVVCGISSQGSWEVRNLAFNAGTACAYGLTKEQALEAITLIPARLLGMEKLIGSLEEGKNATLLVVSGDLLNMAESKIEQVMIDGKEINLSANPQQQLYEKYEGKFFGK